MFRNFREKKQNKTDFSKYIYTYIDIYIYTPACGRLCAADVCKVIGKAGPWVCSRTSRSQGPRQGGSSKMASFPHYSEGKGPVRGLSKQSARWP